MVWRWGWGAPIDWLHDARRFRNTLPAAIGCLCIGRRRRDCSSRLVAGFAGNGSRCARTTIGTIAAAVYSRGS